MQGRYGVDRWKRWAFWKQMIWFGLVCALAVGCRPDQDSAVAVNNPEVLAVVGEEVITIQALREAIKEQSANHQRFFLGLPQKKALLQELMITRLLAVEARRLGLSEDEEVRLVQRRAAIELLTQQLRNVWQAQDTHKQATANHSHADAKSPDFAAFAQEWLSQQRKKRGVRIHSARLAVLEKRLAYRPPLLRPNPPTAPNPAPRHSPTAPNPAPRHSPTAPNPAPRPLAKNPSPASLPTLMSVPSRATSLPASVTVPSPTSLPGTFRR